MGACRVAHPLIEPVALRCQGRSSSGNARGEFQDVYRYDVLPDPLKVQVVYILRAGIGVYGSADHFGRRQGRESFEAWQAIVATTREERGIFRLHPNANGHDPQAEFTAYLMQAANTVADFLDALEIALGQMATLQCPLLKNDYLRATSGLRFIQEVVDDLNGRFQEHSVGYQITDALQVMRVDSQFMHSETVVPAMRLLHDGDFSGANREFLQAHEFYRHKKYEQCILECAKAFESVMKTIADRRKWPYDKQRDTAAKLVDLMFNQGLFPASLQDEISGGLRKLLSSGLPPLRNKEAGHGAGSAPRSVPAHVAAYALHMTAANILLLANVENEKS